MIKHILQHPRCNVFAGMGTGKTSGTMEAAASLLLFGDVKRILVIAPKRVASFTWLNARDSFAGSFGWITMAVAIGNQEERHAAIRANAMITTINYDNLTWLVDNYGESWPWDMVVLDESTKVRSLRVSIRTHAKSGKKFLAGQGGGRAKALARVALTRVTRWVNLTGTPTLAGLEALWGPSWFLDGGARLGNSFTAFSHRWFRSVPGSDPHKQIIEPMPFAEGQIRNAIQDLTVTIDIKDFVDVGNHIENVIYVDLPEKARRHYNEMAKQLATEIEGKTIEAFSAGAKSQKLLQLASGAAYTDKEGAWVLVHDEKIEALKSVVEEALGMPVLVFYHFKSDLARLQAAFPRARVLDANPKTIDEWNDSKIQMMLVHPQSAGHGLDLQHGSNIGCFFSTNWSAENDAQAIERIGPTRQMQSGYKRAVTIHRIVARDTVEESAVSRLRTRISVQEALLDSLKKYQSI